MPKRKAYLAIASPNSTEPLASITIEYETENQMLDAQFKLCQLMADEFLNRADKESKRR